MKTAQYNPSKLELEFNAALQAVKENLQEALPQYTLENFTPVNNRDNPYLEISLTDADGDRHELVLSIIQRADK